MKKYTTPLIFLFLCVGSTAQVTIQDKSTDSVNVFSVTEQSVKSAKLAMAASFVLPGMGHQYLGRAQSAFAYIGVDILSLFGAIFSEQYSRKLESDARGYAGLYASVKNGTKDDYYWRVIGEFNDMESYNQAVRLNRDFDEEYTDGKMSWKWIDDSFREEYSQIMKNSRQFHTAASFFIGAMVLNRIVAFVDIRATTRYKGIKSTAFQPLISPDFTSAGIAVSAGF